MLGATELVQLQTDAATILDKSCAVSRKTTAPDGLGSETESRTVISPPDLECGMAEPTAGQLQNYAYLIGDLAAWRVHLPIGTDIEIQDHLLVEGQTLIVQVDLTPRSYPALITVLATEIKGRK